MRRQDHCLRIDAKTGKLLGTFPAPESKDGEKSIWGYIAYHDGIVFGTLSNPEHVVAYRYQKGGDMKEQLTESTSFFALDAESGNLLWRYDAKHSIRHNAIAIGNDAVVLIDRPLATFDRARKSKEEGDEHPTGELLALYTHNGDVRWRNAEDIYGTVAAISEVHHSVMMSYQPTSFRLASEVGGRISVFDLSNGKLKWETEAKYGSRPLINHDTIYAQGGAWDVMTGAERQFNFKRSYGCGILAGSREMMVFRSATLGYFDLARNEETENYGGIRPGCWINVIPAGGLVFAPDGSAGCKCSYLNQSWIALEPGGVRAPTIDADRDSSPGPIEVSLRTDFPAKQKIYYTLDGSLPDEHSKIYEQPLVIEQSRMLRARAFSDQGRPSPVAETEFLIDPYFLSLEASDWKAEDAPGAKPPSEWSIRKGAIEQSSNIALGGKHTLENSADVERLGSLYVLQGGEPFGDGELSFEFALGIMTRWGWCCVIRGRRNIISGR